MNIGPILGLVLAGSACDGADPAKGGFFSGLSGLAGGCYEERVDAREQAVRESERTRDAIEVERRELTGQTAAASIVLGRLKDEHLELKRRIVKLTSDLSARRVELDGATRSTMHRVLTSELDRRGGAVKADSDHIESLRAAIEDARALVEKLSGL